MKKISYFMFAFVVSTSAAIAKPVTPVSAKTVAENFYKQNSKIELNTSTLVHTELSKLGTPVYYAFNVNNSDGFVIVAADDVVKPIIGYSTESKFVVPEAHTNISFWLSQFSNNISDLQKQGTVANEKTAQEWAKYTTTNLRQANGAASTMNSGTVVTPLLKTLWSQNPYYNALCPGGSVTGCVATTMAQIMKYWAYPAQGTGSSSYTCTTAHGYTNNYGVLSANYGTTTYNWANMPISVNSANSDVATLMYQAGVSVDMNYDPSGSGAQVLQASAGLNKPCAQRSYYTYFKYDPSQIQGYQRDNLGDDTAWIALIEGDLNIGRPVQYAGYDPSEGGHTWVCDGYDINNNLHMNWGWAGSDDGYFDINNLLTTNGGFNPSDNHQILVGIVPMATTQIDASIAAITNPVGAYCNNNFTPSITLKNYGSTALTSCTINYQIDNGTVQTLNWTGTLASQQSTAVSLPNYTSAAGSHTLTCYSSNPNASTDGNTANDQSVTVYSVGSMAPLPVVEGFENTTASAVTWSMMHSISTGVDWAITTNAAATGANSIMIDNMNNTAGNNSTIQTTSSYDLSSFNSPSLTFKAAYQQKVASSADKLQVYVSTDCGANWVSKKVFTAATLAALSGGPNTAAYTPTSAQFTTYSVNINSVATSQTVTFRWVYYSDANGTGNNLYMDDINIVDANATGIKNIETAVDLNIYPNPSSGNVNLSFNLTNKQNVAVNVVDMLGRTVETIPAQQYASGETVLTIANKTTYQAGVYFVNINIDGQQVSKKIIIE